MLVLSRKIGERICIGGNITIEIRRVAGNRVTLALDAPRTVRILRGELEQAVREFRDQPERNTTTDGHTGREAETTQDNDDEATNHNQSGPEPFAVIHRRLHVLPQYSPQPTLTPITPTVT